MGNVAGQTQTHDGDGVGDAWHDPQDVEDENSATWVDEEAFHTPDDTWYAEDESFTPPPLPPEENSDIQDERRNAWNESRSSSGRVLPYESLTVASKCLVTGLGLMSAQAGVPATFYIRARDESGRDITVGGDPFVVDLVGGGQVWEALVHDNKNGSYSVTYVVERSGEYEIVVTLQGKRIRRRPFFVYVEPADTSPSRTNALGDGLTSATVDEPASFIIQARDTYGNKCIRGGNAIKVEMSGAATFEPTVTDHRNGTYGVSYQARFWGEYEIAITCEGMHIDGSPFYLNVKAGRGHGPNCVATGKGLKRAVAGQHASFVIQSRDTQNNNRDTGGDHFDVTIRGPEQLCSHIVDHGDGTHSVTYTARRTGEYDIHVTLCDYEIQRSPFPLDVYPAPSNPAKCTMTGEGTRMAVAGERATFRIKAMDEFGNIQEEGGDYFAILILGPETNEEPERHTAQVVDNQDSTYDVSYRLIVSGTYKMYVDLRDRAVANAPLDITVVPADTSALHCTAQGGGLASSVVGIPASFTIQARDQFGNRRTTGCDVFIVKVEGLEEFSGNIVDTKNGEYQVTYTMPKKGKHKLDVLLLDGGEHIAGSPFSVECREYVSVFLERIGMLAYEKAFMGERIDQHTLLSLDEDLLIDMGVARMGDRLKILRAIQSLEGHKRSSSPSSEVQGEESVFLLPEEGAIADIPESFCGVPERVVLKIFSYLSVEDLCSVSMVCALWRNLAERDDLWQELYKERFSLLEDAVETKGWKIIYARRHLLGVGGPALMAKLIRSYEQRGEMADLRALGQEVRLEERRRCVPVQVEAMLSSFHPTPSPEEKRDIGTLIHGTYFQIFRFDEGSVGDQSFECIAVRVTIYGGLGVSVTLDFTHDQLWDNVTSNYNATLEYLHPDCKKGISIMRANHGQPTVVNLPELRQLCRTFGVYVKPKLLLWYLLTCVQCNKDLSEVYYLDRDEKTFTE